jgi:hypothetical protein
MAVTYRVTAPLVLAKDKEGKVHERYEGAVIDWLPPEQVEHFLGASLVERIGNVPAGDGSAEAVGGKPDADATKAVLIAWLVDNAVDEDGSDYTAAKLQPLNKGALWELIDAVED